MSDALRMAERGQRAPTAHLVGPHKGKGAIGSRSRMEAEVKTGMAARV